MNNTTIRVADSTTHLKIVATALVASIAVIGIAISARTVPSEGLRVGGDATGLAAKVGRSYLMSRIDTAAIR